MQVTRLLTLGLLLAATVHFARTVRRRPGDTLPRIATVFLVHAFGVMAMRTAMHAQLPELATTIAVRLGATSSACGAAVLGYVFASKRARPAIAAAFTAMLLLVWIDGAAFRSSLRVIETTRGETFHALSPGAGWPVFLMSLGALVMHAGWRGHHATEDRENRRVAIFCTAVAAASLGWDAVLDAGYVQGVPTIGWGIGITLVVLVFVTFRRMRRAHGDLVQHLTQQRKELVREREELAAKEHLSALGTLSEGLGHELNNPLAAISLNLTWLRKKLRNESRSIERDAPAIESLDAAKLLVRDIEATMRDFADRFSDRESHGDSIAPTSARHPSPPRLLVVDDDPLIVRALQRALESFAVTAAETGDDALAELRRQPFDAVLCDVMMPKMTGVELYRRAVVEWPDLAQRFVFVTGGTFGEPMVNAVTELPGPVLRKPIDGADITAAVRARIAAARDELAADSA